MKDRHREGYYRDYYARSNKAKAKSRQQAAQQKAERQARKSLLPKCSVCGEPMVQRGFARDVCGFHRDCDRAEYMRLKRAQK